MNYFAVLVKLDGVEMEGMGTKIYDVILFQENQHHPNDHAAAVLPPAPLETYENIHILKYFCHFFTTFVYYYFASKKRFYCMFRSTMFSDGLN